jgi:hypothetical protein
MGYERVIGAKGLRFKNFCCIVVLVISWRLDDAKLGVECLGAETAWYFACFTKRILAIDHLFRRSTLFLKA